MNKEDFCSYLEETAAELRAFRSSKEYLFDVCCSLIQHTKNFEARELEENRIRAVDAEYYKDE
jgi:hypothetical protein